MALKACRASISAIAIMVAATLCFPSLVAAAQAPQAVHPLDPLTGAEIELAARLALSNSKVSDESRFTFIALAEPDKQSLYDGLKTIKRRAEVGLYDREENLLQEVTVNLSDRKVEQWKSIPGAQPVYLEDDDPLLVEILEYDDSWQAALEHRGLRMQGLSIVGLSMGDLGPVEDAGDRLVMAIVRLKPTESAHGGLVAGLTAYVNLTERRVIEVINTGSSLPRQEDGFESIAEEVTPERPAWVEGNQQTFSLKGHEIIWEPWHLRFGVHPREGLVLYSVRLRDEDSKLRMVLYRASLSEMAVPYGDPEIGWHARNIFDAGEAGMATYGKSSLMRGIDAPENAVFVDAVVNDESGKAVVIPDAVAIFERVTGALWRHDAYGVPGRELVLLSYATIDNYDYGFQWIFKEDGSITVEMVLTGIMASKAADSEATSKSDSQLAHGYRVSRTSVAPNHQHFFNFRLDFDIGGPNNDQVSRIEAKGLPVGERNPYGNAIVTVEHALSSEREAADVLSMASSRRWKIATNEHRNALGQPMGFWLKGGENGLPFAAHESSFVRRAGFATRHFWVTPYAANERYAAGDYPFNGTGTDGLKAWTSANRRVANTDVVIWYTVGIMHFPRSEEWPVMPAHRAAFRIVPAGFFTRNPALRKPQ